MNEQKCFNEIGRSVFLLVTVENAGVLCACGMKTDEIVIVSDEHAVFSGSKCEMLFIRCFKQAGIRRC